MRDTTYLGLYKGLPEPIPRENVWEQDIDLFQSELIHGGNSMYVSAS